MLIFPILLFDFNGVYKMDLNKKGQEAQLSGIKQFMVSLQWTTESDFDLSAAYESRARVLFLGFLRGDWCRMKGVGSWKTY